MTLTPATEKAKEHINEIHKIKGDINCKGCYALDRDIEPFVYRGALQKFVMKIGKDFVIIQYCPVCGRKLG